MAAERPVGMCEYDHATDGSVLNVFKKADHIMYDHKAAHKAALEAAAT